MKQVLDLTKEDITPKELEFIMVWKRRKFHNDLPTLTIGETIELLIATTYNLHKDHSDSRFFNNILSNNESAIAWDGDQLIDILFYEARIAIRKRLS